MLEINLISKYIDPENKMNEAKRISASEKLRIDINFEEDLLRMLDKSLLCIYLLTGDEMFYQLNKDKLKLKGINN